MQTLASLLNKCKPADNTFITHTRIGNASLNVRGGKYAIKPEDMALFYKLYHKKVFIDKKFEYLTEKQKGKAILVDLDFRYSADIEERQHDENFIIEIVVAYLEVLSTLIIIPSGTEIPIFVFEKDDVNTLPDITKDGIHIVFGIKMDHTLQLILRTKMLDKLKPIFDNIPVENTLDSIVDISISRGSTNWQLFGSRKPGNDAYKLTNKYIAEWQDNEWSPLHTVNKTEINTLDLLLQSSAQYEDNQEFTIKPEIKPLYEKQQKPATTTIIKAGVGASFDYTNYNAITSPEALQLAIDSFLSNISYTEYYLREIHEYVMALPEKFYSNYDEWLRVGFALHNTSNRMFLSWLVFSSQWDKFDFSNIMSCYGQWKNMSDKGVTSRSIIYWCKEHNPAQYKKIYQKSLSYYIDKSIETKTDHSMALVLYHMYRGRFVCASIKHKTWFEFRDHKWEMIDSGTTLRSHISNQMQSIYYSSMQDVIANIAISPDSPNANILRGKVQTFGKAVEIMGNVDGKNKIMREAQELFYDNNFLQNLDTKEHLLHFKNGVYDFKQKKFRNGVPEDYISLSTGRYYIPFNKDNPDHIEKKKCINDFMAKLFTDEDLRRYMWDHLASVLIGTNENETFNIYNGVGRNGKSKMVDLMGIVLGELKGVVPITLITRKRGDSGKASPELALLRGVRYAVLQEPTKNDKINEGLMKELTGGDTIQARALYQEPIQFKPQFKLAVCTNNLFDIDSNDDGTWRRIRVCQFSSKFCRNPSKDPKDKEFLGIKPSVLLSKFTTWAPVMTTMLIDRVNQTGGVVKDCESVLAASNKYRGSQDYFSNFFDDCIISVELPENTEKPQKGMRLGAVYEEFISWWREMGYGGGVPKRSELQANLEKKLGAYNKVTCWQGYKIRPPEGHI